MKMKVCAYAVIPNKDKYILVKSKNSKKWNLPGGAMKKEESLLEACLRETKEETKLDVNLNSALFAKKYKTGKNKSKFKSFFAASPNYGKVKIKKEINKSKKFSHEEIKKLEEEGKLKQGVYEAITQYTKEKFYSINIFQ